MKVGYMINGIGIQLLASLGYDHFRNIINFISVLLNKCRNEHKKYKRCQQTNVILKQQCKENGNHINYKQSKNKNKANNVEHLSRQQQYRTCQKIDKNFNYHAKRNNIHVDSVIDTWISHKSRTQPYIFKQNKELAITKQRKFNQMQKQLWNQFKNDSERIKHLTLNYTNRRQSFRDIQSHRFAVRKRIIF